MTDFREIAEQVLAGKIKGFFILRDGTAIHSNCLHRGIGGAYPYKLNDFTYTEYGNVSLYVTMKRDIIKFKKKEEEMEEKRKIEINVPENKIAIIEENSERITITWKEKELTFKEIYNNLVDKDQQISSHRCCNNCNSQQFNKKVEVLRKLTMIRNYFGKPKHNTCGHVLYYTIEQGIHTIPALYPSNDQRVIFDTKKHAEQAIKMLGDELKYLFEPW